MMKNSKSAAVLITIAILVVPVFAGQTKVSPLLTDMFSNVTASGGTTIVPDRTFVLHREGDRVRATIIGDLDAAAYAGDLELIVTREHWSTGWVTADGLSRLERDPDIHAVYPPLRAQPLDVISEGRAAMGWDVYHARGVGGQGVRVAIVDVGFSGYQSLIGSELPASVHYENFISPIYRPLVANEDHGTAVAEIIHDIAPDADLIFLSVIETSDIFEAVQWCIDHDVQVVNMSLGFIAGPRDGTSVVSLEIDRAADAGIIWANSAGNSGYAHWGGTWADANANNYLDFSPGVETIQVKWSGNGSLLTVASSSLIWDRWPTTEGLSFNLEIYNDAAMNQLLATSGDGPVFNLAYREASLNAPDAAHTYYMAVKRSQGTPPAGLRLEIYSDPNATVLFLPHDSSSSLVIPADARGAITVGAYDYTVTTPGANPIRIYSGQGPTWDGRTKPEIVAADGITTATYGPFNFYGTSAASPHIAGAAALLASASVSGGLFTYVWSPADFVRLMAVNSIDFGAAGTDNTYGVGGAKLPPATASPDSFTVARAYPNPSNAGVNVAFAARPGTSFALRIYDVLGRLVWQTQAMHIGRGDARIHWPGTDQAGKKVGSGVYFYRIDTDFRTLTGKAVILK